MPSSKIIYKDRAITFTQLTKIKSISLLIFQLSNSITPITNLSAPNPQIKAIVSSLMAAIDKDPLRKTNRFC